MQSLKNDLFIDPTLDADNELIVAGDTSTGSTTACSSGSSDIEIETESDGDVIVITGCIPGFE